MLSARGRDVAQGSALQGNQAKLASLTLLSPEPAARGPRSAGKAVVASASL